MKTLSAAQDFVLFVNLPPTNCVVNKDTQTVTESAGLILSHVVMHQPSTVLAKMTLVLSTAAVAMERNAVKREKAASLTAVCAVLLVKKNAMDSAFLMKSTAAQKVNLTANTQMDARKMESVVMKSVDSSGAPTQTSVKRTAAHSKLSTVNTLDNVSKISMSAVLQRPHIAGIPTLVQLTVVNTVKMCTMSIVILLTTVKTSVNAAQKELLPVCAKVAPSTQTRNATAWKEKNVVTCTGAMELTSVFKIKNHVAQPVETLMLENQMMPMMVTCVVLLEAPISPLELQEKTVRLDVAHITKLPLLIATVADLLSLMRNQFSLNHQPVTAL